jgi:DNA ligase (NAD+)
MNPIDEMRELIDKLNYYIKMYDEGTPVITDKEYDDLYFKLEQLEEETGIYLTNSPSVHVDYFSINELKKVKHSHPMLSLDKTKSIQEVLDFIGDKDIIAMLKMDGLTCSLRYEEGLLVSAETRGNGEIGEDILHNMATVKYVPMQIPFKDVLVVDGEVICTYKDFAPFSDKFANPRNFAAGSIRLLNNGECANRHLTFIAWDVIEGFDDCKTLTEKLYKLDNLGFTFVPHLPWPTTLPHTEEKFNHMSMLLTDWAKKEEYPYDGLVFKYNNCEYYQSLGATGHHFKGGLAFKFYDEEYETTLLNIEWSMGKTG